MPTLERARAKHNDIVDQLNKVTMRRDKYLDLLLRWETRRIKMVRAVSRSTKRVDKIKALAKVNAPLKRKRKDEPNLSSTALPAGTGSVVTDLLA